MTLFRLSFALFPPLLFGQCIYIHDRIRLLIDFLAQKDYRVRSDKLVEKLYSEIIVAPQAVYGLYD